MHKPNYSEHRNSNYGVVITIIFIVAIVVGWLLTEGKSLLIPKDGMTRMDKFFDKYKEDFRNTKWQRVEANEDFGWFEEYEINTEDIYVSVSYGKTEEGKKKLAFNIAFGKETPSHYYHQYYEDNEPKSSNFRNPVISPHRMVRWLTKKGIFHFIEGFPPHLRKEIIKAVDLEVDLEEIGLVKKKKQVKI